MASTLPAQQPTAPHLLHPTTTPPSTSSSTTTPSTPSTSSSTTTPSTPSTPSTTTTSNPRHDLRALFNYYLDPGDGSGPAPSYVGKPETYERPSFPLTLPVRDMRGEEGRYSLDTTGFQVHRHESRERAFEDEGEIRRVYYPEVEGILKAATGASQVFIFDHTIRRQTTDQRLLPPSAAPSPRGPVQRVHIDQSYSAGPDRVRHHMPADADRLLTGRYQIINVWRPIKTIRKDPLGVADASSVPDADLLPVQLIYPDRVGETFTVRPNEAHRWHYLREQTPAEVLLIKCFDSKTDGRARRAPHSAFVDEGAEGEAPRESIEVRALVFHPDNVE